jgi:DNA recombination protein Rad52
MAWRAAQGHDCGGLSRDTLDLLSEPLNPELIGERETRDGRTVQYLEGWAAIHQANRIFGPDQWAAELVDGVSYHPLRLIDDVSGEQLATGIYTATVRVTVRGCLPKTDVGCAFVRRETLEEYETACKGAVTDATKRALRQFGDQFGNRLYDKHARLGLPEATRTGAPKKDAAEMRRRVVNLSVRLGRTEENTLLWVRERYESSLNELSDDQLADAVRFISSQLNQRTSAAHERRNGHSTVA